MFKIWALDVVEKYQSTLVLDAFIEQELSCKVWPTHGLRAFSLEKDNITYGWNLVKWK